MIEYDVLTISDFRLPGGSSHSSAQELAVQRSMGLRTGLIQSHSRLVAKALPWAEVITRELSSPSVEPLLPGVRAHARLALVRHPIAAESMPDVSKSLEVDTALIIANQPALRPDGQFEYDPVAVTETVHLRLGVEPTWAPIGPVVRRSLSTHREQIQLLPYDWTNIFSQVSTMQPRSGLTQGKIRIGRHSRPQPAKWPSTRAELLQAYPSSGEYEVWVLGGASPAAALLGELPKNWNVLPFGAMDPMEFLKEIDFWVYYHHPEWSEAYGRAIMEALWSGAVVILPEYLRITYGDAAVYGRPSEVAKIIAEFRDGTRDYLQQSRVGQSFARTHGPDVHKSRLLEILASSKATSTQATRATAHDSTAIAVVEPRAQVLSTSRRRPTGRFVPDPRPRALFVTSNGAGMGHLTRMLGLARVAASDFDPVFFSMSQGSPVVSAAGFPYEYVPFTSALQTKSELWHAYMEDRLLAAIDAYRARVVLFDGTWPYRGLLAALDQRDVMRVWVRRSMWKETIGPEQLLTAPHFDLVIEPGEHAHAYDTGATTTVTDAIRVGPMTVLSDSEVLTRAQALAELGLPDAPQNRYALVAMGAGTINDLGSTVTDVLGMIREQQGWEALLTQAPISTGAPAQGARVLRAFPLARYTRAFDFAVSAAGYNSFAEWVSGRLPTVWIPNLSTMTDDQDARARWAADMGYGLRASEGNSDEICSAIAQMLNDETREAFVGRLGQLPVMNGTEAAASLLTAAWRSFLQNRGVVL